ncbi:MAG: hypothetical protein FJ222_00570 [Lentisphaerae bacterium]|nr:hypothetical protein [Lentisphaerota bacterium]
MNADKTDTRQWFLRIAGKTIFGPVSTSGIVVWAEQGRILPGHEVSTDQTTWLPAEQVPELGIAWYIDDGAGNLRGPLNRTAADAILTSGKAPPDARLVYADKADLARVIRPGAEPRAASAPTEKSSKECDALRHRITALEAENARQKETLAAAKQATKQCAALEHERDSLRLALAEAEKRAIPESDIARLREAASASESKRLAAEQERDACRAQAAEAVRKQAAAEQRGAHAERLLEEARVQIAASDRAQAMASAHADTLKREIAEVQSAYSDLLTLSNSRETELQARIADLEKPLSPVARAAEACAADPLGAIAQILGQEVERLENDLALEREAVAGLRDWTTRRQEAIQSRIYELTRILSGEMESTATRRHAADPGNRRHPADAVRLQAEMATLRATQAQEARLADERESELNRKIRVLEAEDARLRTRVTETDKLARQTQELAETIRRREQDLSQERKQREVEREHHASTQQALLRRIDQLEHSQESRSDETPSPSVGGDTCNPAPFAPNRGKLSSWIRLKR